MCGVSWPWLRWGSASVIFLVSLWHAELLVAQLVANLTSTSSTSSLWQLYCVGSAWLLRICECHSCYTWRTPCTGTSSSAWPLTLLSTTSCTTVSWSLRQGQTSTKSLQRWSYWGNAPYCHRLQPSLTCKALQVGRVGQGNAGRAAGIDACLPADALRSMHLF
jgi:hypothetical protein